MLQGVSSVRYRSASDDTRPLLLTRRELEVLQLVAEGCRNIDIAIELDVCVSTVEYHVGNVLTKLGVRSRWEIIDATRHARMQHPEQHPR